MNYIRTLGLGVLFGLSAAFVVAFGPLYPHSLPARIWNVEEKPLDWLQALMDNVLHMNPGIQMLILYALHFALWAVLGILVFWAAAILFSKLSPNE